MSSNRQEPGVLAATLPVHVEPETTHRSVVAREHGDYLLVFEEGRAWVFRMPRSGEVIIGRADTANLVIADASVSRNHLRLTVTGDEVQVVDLGSQNGTRVNGEPLVGSRMLASGDTLTAGKVTLAFHSDARAGAGQRLVNLSTFRQRCEEELERSLRYHRPLSLLCLALSTTVVDRPRVEAALKGRLRLLDLMSWGPGDNLLALLPETGADRAPIAAERLVGLLEGVDPGVRAGLASCPIDGCDVTTLLASARAAVQAEGSERVAIASQAYRELRLGEVSALVADPVMSRLYGLVERLAASDLPVLVAGETGAGKELVASAIHHFSPRRTGPLVTVNCAALSESLLEGELFGWERGAFSGAVSARAGHLESASGGTVFLDEVGELTAAAQAKLLRVLETKRVMRLGDSRERPIDIRLVAATNRDLESEVRSGRFRQDLFFRLSGARLWIPPLRDRPRELPLLARGFLADACRRMGREPLSLAADTVRLMAAHAWPGNVRELKHLADYLAATVTEGPVLAEHLPEGLAPARRQGDPTSTRPPTELGEASPFRKLDEELRDLEKSRIVAALAHTDGNQTKAAALLGVPRRTFVSKLREYGLGGAGSGET